MVEVIWYSCSEKRLKIWDMLLKNRDVLKLEFEYMLFFLIKIGGVVFCESDTL